jgi:hypothetical protein
MSVSTLTAQVPHNGRWSEELDLQAFRSGWIAASAGKPRVCPWGPSSYNQRAAFMDGWDAFQEQGLYRRTRKR